MFQGKKTSCHAFSFCRRQRNITAPDSILTNTDHESSVTLRNEVDKKHPLGQPAHSSIILDACDSDIHPVVFECIDGAAISKAAICTNSSAGPSGLDASGWKQLCESFQSYSVDLCNNLALVARRICTVYVDQQGLAPFTACRLIALNKCPGTSPLGVRETSRRICS